MVDPQIPNKWLKRIPQGRPMDDSQPNKVDLQSENKLLKEFIYSISAVRLDTLTSDERAKSLEIELQELKSGMEANILLNSSLAKRNGELGMENEKLRRELEESKRENVERQRAVDQTRSKLKQVCENAILESDNRVIAETVLVPAKPPEKHFEIEHELNSKLVEAETQLHDTRKQLQSSLSTINALKRRVEEFRNSCNAGNSEIIRLTERLKKYEQVGDGKSMPKSDLIFELEMMNSRATKMVSNGVKKQVISKSSRIIEQSGEGNSVEKRITETGANQESKVTQHVGLQTGFTSKEPLKVMTSIGIQTWEQKEPLKVHSVGLQTNEPLIPTNWAHVAVQTVISVDQYPTMERLQELEKKNQNLAAELDQKLVLLGICNDKVVSLAQKVDELETEKYNLLEKLKVSNVDIEIIAGKHQNAVQMLDLATKDLEKQQADASQSNTLNHETVERLNSNIVLLQEDLNTVHTRASEVESALNSVICSMQSKIDDLNGETLAWQSKCLQLNHDLSLLISKEFHFQSKQLEMENLISNLNKDLLQSNQTLNDLQHENNNLVYQIQEQAKTITASEAKMSNLKYLNLEAGHQIEDLLSQKNHMQIIINEMEHDMTQLRLHADNLNLLINEYHSELQQAHHFESEFKLISEKMVLTQNKLNELQARIEISEWNRELQRQRSRPINSETEGTKTIRVLSFDLRKKTSKRVLKVVSETF